MKKKIQEILALIVLMLFPVMTANMMYAADADVGNVDTGSGSTNTATVSVVRAISVVIVNEADIENKVDLDANTGENEANKNSGDGAVMSGDIDGTVEVKNQANVVDTSSLIPTASSTPLKVATSNHQTGANSVNTAGFGSTNDQKVSIRNDLNVDNKLEADLNTGGNEANGNTGNGSVKSGDISFKVAFATFGNLVKVAIGDVSVPNNGGTTPEENFEGVSAAEFAGVAAATLPVAGANGMVLMLILSAISTVFIVELMNRRKQAKLAH